jgi:hypothetical protein
MTDTTTERAFVRLLLGNLATKWDAILISGGGNDVIDAATAGPANPPDQRLLSTPAERGNEPLQPEQYLSEPGWQTFVQHLTVVFDSLVDKRDAGVNRHVPMVFHSYAHMMPRPSPAGAGKGPWLEPAMLAFAIPLERWLSVSNVLLDRLEALLSDLIVKRRQQDPACALHLVDTRTAGLKLGNLSATGKSGDFQNEIHPTTAGYKKLGVVWRATLDTLI